MKTYIIKHRVATLLGATIMIAMSHVSEGAALLIDMYNSANPSSSADWSNAGVTLDLTGAAGGTFVLDSRYNIDNLTMTFSGATTTLGRFTGSQYPSNNMLKDYAFVNNTVDPTLANVSIGGFVNGSGVANTLTTNSGYAGLNGNTFTLQANSAYKLYLFGTGNTGENTTFTYNTVAKTTNASIPGLGEGDNHFVTFDVTTPADLTGYTLNFSFGSPSATYAAFNGLALVAVPEPTAPALLLGGLVLLATRRRRS